MIELEHDRSLIERLAATTEGNARAHLALMREKSPDDRRGWTRHEMLAASGFAIAASYWSLIDPRRAVAAYRIAADTYRKMGHGYWIVAALATADKSAADAAGSLKESEPASPQTLAFAMIADAMVADRNGIPRFESMSRWLAHYGNVPVGRLGIPLGVYGRCAHAMSIRNRDLFAREAQQYISRAAEVIDAASHDHFHWRSLRTSVLPAEPEAVAMTTAMATVAREMQIDPQEMTAHTGAHGQLLMDVGIELRDAAPGNDRRNDGPRYPRRESDPIEVRESELPAGEDDELRALVREYDRVREKMRPGAERSQVMNGIATRMREQSRSWEERLPQLIQSRSPGERLAAVLFLQDHPNPRYLDWLSKRFSEEQPFIGHRAAMALLTAARTLPSGLVREALLRALEAVGRGTAREQVLREALVIVDSRR